ncbi:MAG: AMP-binding protein, partial [Limisphaerales bacterium]
MFIYYLKATMQRCIHPLFETQAGKNPDAVAVIFEGKKLTYRELNQKSNQLAHYLRQQGIGPESLVGMCVERSLEMIIGILGILKAGGAYVPLDLAYPKDRLAFILEDSAVPVLLTQEKLLNQIPDLTGKNGKSVQVI